LEAGVEERAEKLATAISDLEDLQHSVELKNEEILTLTTKRDSLLSEHNASTDNLSELNLRISDLTAEVTRLNSKIDNLRNDVLQTTAEWREAVFEVGLLTIDINELNMDINRLSTQQDELQGRNNILSSELNQANIDIYQLSSGVQLATEEALDVFESRAVPSDISGDLSTTP